MVPDSMAGARQDRQDPGFQYHGKGAAAYNGCSSMGPMLGGKASTSQMRHVGGGHGQHRLMQGTRRNASEEVSGLLGGQVVVPGEGCAHPESKECGGLCVVTPCALMQGVRGGS